MIELNNKDADIVFKAGRDAVQRLIDKAQDEKIQISEAGSERLTAYYSEYIQHEAKKIDMAGTAEGMRALTNEIEILMTSIKLDIERNIKKTL